MRGVFELRSKCVLVVMVVRRTKDVGGRAGLVNSGLHVCGGCIS